MLGTFMADFHELLGRIGSFAVIDIVGTIIGVEILMFLIAAKKPIAPMLRVIGYIFGFSFGVLAHEFVGVDTPLNSLLLG